MDECAYAVNTGLTDETVDDHLVQDVAKLVRVENQINFAHILKETVEHFNEDLDQIESAQLALLLINDEYDGEGGEGTEHNFALSWQRLAIGQEVGLPLLRSLLFRLNK